MKQAVATILRLGAWYIALEQSYKLEGVYHKSNNILAPKVTLHKQVITGETAHWTPIHNPVRPLLIVSEKGGGKMFYGMKGTLMQCRFTVRGFHTDIERGDSVVAYTVFSADINARQQSVVVDCKTWYLFHYLQTFDKIPRYVETAFCHTVPKIEIL